MGKPVTYGNEAREIHLEERKKVVSGARAGFCIGAVICILWFQVVQNMGHTFENPSNPKPGTTDDTLSIRLFLRIGAEGGKWM